MRVSGLATQLSCAACLLIGTIGLVLVQQTKAADVLPLAAWLLGALAGLVFGGLTYRGGMLPMVIAAAIDAAFGVLLILLEYGRLRELLRILPASDIGTISDALGIAGFVMIAAAAVCLAALPQGIAYARWFRDAAETRNAMSTARGFPPPPVPATAAYVIPSEDRPEARRRLYMVLGGLAIGVGAGVGVLVSSTPASSVPATAVLAEPVAAPVVAAPAPPTIPTVPEAVPVAPAETPTVPDAEPTTAFAVAPVAREPVADPGPATATVDELLAAQRAAIATVDAAALGALIAPTAFGFGVDADEIGEGRAAVVAQLVRDLGEPPAGGFTVTSKALAIGEERGHAWIAEDLEVASPGGEQRRLAITQLAASLAGKWRVLALHWAVPVDDATAERLAILKTLPAPRAVPDRSAGPDDLDDAVRAAFSTRTAFADARSERPDAFNLGSGGERVRGLNVKRVFRKLRADIRMHDGAFVVGGGAWDPAQAAAPWIGFAAVNADFTSKARAGVDVTQTFRVLAILLKNGPRWQVVQTHWSNGGPIR